MPSPLHRFALLMCTLPVALHTTPAALPVPVKYRILQHKNFLKTDMCVPAQCSFSARLNLLLLPNSYFTPRNSKIDRSCDHQHHPYHLKHSSLKPASKLSNTPAIVEHQDLHTHEDYDTHHDSLLSFALFQPDAKVTTAQRNDGSAMLSEGRISAAVSHLCLGVEINRLY